jgi:hypothetical protein
VALPLAIVLGVLGIVIYRGSSEVFPNRNPTGERFPTVVGQSLQEERTEMPTDFVDPTVLLIGYKQEAQFDIDRWIMGLLQTEVSMQIVEVPTIPGLLPSFASGWIDDGMRSGIPREDWGSVVTLYGDAARPVAEFTGTERGRLTRVIVLDRQGTVAWFDDAGYSARKAMEVAEVVSGID